MEATELFQKSISLFKEYLSEQGVDTTFTGFRSGKGIQKINDEPEKEAFISKIDAGFICVGSGESEDESMIDLLFSLVVFAYESSQTNK